MRRKRYRTKDTYCIVEKSAICVLSVCVLWEGEHTYFKESDIDENNYNLNIIYYFIVLNINFIFLTLYHTN